MRGSHTRSRGYRGHCPSEAPAEGGHHTSVRSTDGTTRLVATGPRCLGTIGAEARIHVSQVVPKRNKNKPAGGEDPFQSPMETTLPNSLLLQRMPGTEAVTRSAGSSRDHRRSGAGQTPAQDLSEDPKGHLQMPGLRWLYGACNMRVGNSPPPEGVTSLGAKLHDTALSLGVGGGGGHPPGDNIASGTLAVSMKHSHVKSTDRTRGSLTTGACSKSPSRVFP